MYPSAILKASIFSWMYSKSERCIHFGENLSMKEKMCIWGKVVFMKENLYLWRRRCIHEKMKILIYEQIYINQGIIHLERKKICIKKGRIKEKMLPQIKKNLEFLISKMIKFKKSLQQKAKNYVGESILAKKISIFATASFL